MYGTLITAALILVWGILIPGLLLALRKARHAPARPPAELAPLCRQALAIARFAGQCAACAKAHRERTAFFNALHALPDYPATQAKPAPAGSAGGKTARMVVLDMQAQLAQTLRSLRAHPHARLDEHDCVRLQQDAKRLWAKLKQLHPLTAARP